MVGEGGRPGAWLALLMRVWSTSVWCTIRGTWCACRCFEHTSLNYNFHGDHRHVGTNRSPSSGGLPCPMGRRRPLMCIQVALRSHRSGISSFSLLPFSRANRAGSGELSAREQATVGLSPWLTDIRPAQVVAVGIALSSAQPSITSP